MKPILLEATAALIIYKCNKRETLGATHQTPVEPTVQNMAKMQHPQPRCREANFFHTLVLRAKMTFSLLLGKNFKLCRQNGKSLDVLNATDWENLKICLGKDTPLYLFDLFYSRVQGELCAKFKYSQDPMLRIE